MIVYIISNATKEIVMTYDTAEVSPSSFGPQYQQPHMSHAELPQGVDSDCVRVESVMETVTVEVPARIDPQTGVETPASTREETRTRCYLVADQTLVAAKAQRLKAERRREKINAFKAAQAVEIEAETGIPYADTAGVDYVGLLDMEMNPSRFMQSGVPGFSTAAEVKAWATAQLEPYRRITKKRGPARRRLADELAQET